MLLFTWGKERRGKERRGKEEKLRQEDCFNFKALLGYSPENLSQNNPLLCGCSEVSPFHMPPALTLPLGEEELNLGLILGQEGGEAQESEDTLFPGGRL